MISGCLCIFTVANFWDFNTVCQIVDAVSASFDIQYIPGNVVERILHQQQSN